MPQYYFSVENWMILFNFQYLFSDDNIQRDFIDISDWTFGMFNEQINLNNYIG